MTENGQIKPNEKKMSFQDVLKIAKAYLIEILKYSWLMVICGVLLGKFMHDRKMSTPRTYRAEFSFTFNEGGNENQANIANLFGAAISSGGSEMTFAKLKEIVVTRKIILKVLFHRTTFQSSEEKKEDFLVNHYLRNFHYKNPDAPESFYFQSDSIDPYDRKINSLLMSIHRAIIGNHLIIDSGGGSLIYLKAVSPIEDFSYELITALFEELEMFYKEESLQKKRDFYEMAEKRTNQLRGRLGAAEKKYIEYVNTHGAEAGGRNNTLVETQYLSTDLKKATEAYFTALGSMEAAWVAYEGQKQTNSLVVIDPPLYPLVVTIPDPFLHMILGFIAGSGFVFLIVVGRKFVKDFMAKEKEKEADLLDQQGDQNSTNQEDKSQEVQV